MDRNGNDRINIPTTRAFLASTWEGEFARAASTACGWTRLRDTADSRARQLDGRSNLRGNGQSVSLSSKASVPRSKASARRPSRAPSERRCRLATPTIIISKASREESRNRAGISASTRRTSSRSSQQAVDAAWVSGAQSEGLPSRLGYESGLRATVSAIRSVGPADATRSIPGQ